jgi:maltose O-acetyltransferase
MFNWCHRYKCHKIKKRIKQLNHISNVIVETSSIVGIEHLIVGDNCRFAPGMLINAKGGVNIGHNVIFAPNVIVWSQNHHYKFSNLLPYDVGVINKPVTIGDNCWIGEGVKIAPGVSIGEGVIIAMGSVVFKDIPKLSIVMGNPAIVIKEREDKEHYFTLDKFKDSYVKAKLSAKSR